MYDSASLSLGDVIHALLKKLPLKHASLSVGGVYLRHPHFFSKTHSAASMEAKKTHSAASMEAKIGDEKLFWG